MAKNNYFQDTWQLQKKQIKKDNIIMEVDEESTFLVTKAEKLYIVEADSCFHKLKVSQVSWEFRNTTFLFLTNTEFCGVFYYILIKSACWFISH